uniref:Histone-lysine N-methyltransferase SMYD3-like n=1 Tax=Dermatophagoides pteronyssinus TaxID=6956 RepID=A0A6P6XQP9_DERPT|nr:histone-lysine N-methyltransferase SMYD3-like [Dermatophagoides pteronyssinus]
MTSHRDYQAGEIISISLPFVHVLEEYFKGKNCDYCFVECEQMIKCSECEKMYYCGNDCQQKDSIQHQLECKIFFLLDCFEIEFDFEKMSNLVDICQEEKIEIFDYRLNKLGSGIYIAESQLKHSCSPNAKIMFNGIQLVMRATRTIEIDEEITINNIMQIYVNIHNDVEELSVAELAKQLEIELPTVYNEIFENIYFNREEEATVTYLKALANVEFNFC